MILYFRLVSEKTVEENILKKANQKRLLGDLAIEGGNFTTAYFKSVSTFEDSSQTDVYSIFAVCIFYNNNKDNTEEIYNACFIFGFFRFQFDFHEFCFCF